MERTESQALAQKQGVTLPAPGTKVARQWSKNPKDVLDELSADHQDAIDLFEKAAKSEDAGIAACAQKTPPTLRHYYELVKQQKKINWQADFWLLPPSEPTAGDGSAVGPNNWGARLPPR